MQNNEFDLQPEEEFDLQKEEEFDLQPETRQLVNEGESFVYGINKMIPFSKQISAAGESLISGKPYDQAIKDIEIYNQEAEKQHPYMHTFGQIASSLPQMAMSGAAGIYAPLAETASNVMSALTNEPVGQKVSTASMQAASNLGLPLAGLGIGKAGKALSETDYAQAFVKSSGLDEKWQSIVNSYNNGMAGVSYKSDSYLNSVKDRMNKTYNALENSLNELESAYGGWLRKQVEAHDSKVDISDIAEKHLMQASGGTSIAEQKTQGKLKNFLQDVLYTSPEEMASRVPYKSQATQMAEKKIYVPGESKQVISNDIITGQPTEFVKESINVPSSSYQAPAYSQKQVGIDDITGQPMFESVASGSTKIQQPGYTSEVVTDIPMMKSQQTPGRTTSYMEPKVSQISGEMIVPGKKNVPYSIDIATGERIGNIQHDLSYLQRLKQDLHRNYLDYDTDYLKTGKKPEVDLALQSFKKDIDSVIEQFVPDYRFLNSKYSDVVTAKEYLPNLKQMLDSGKDINSPSTLKALDDFFAPFSSVDSKFAKQAADDLKSIGKEWSDLVMARPELSKAHNVKGNAFQMNMANQLGLMNKVDGRVSRDIKTAKNFGNVILNVLARENPQLAPAFLKALNENDNTTISTMAAQVAPMFNDILQPPIISSKGALDSYFDGKIHDPMQKQIHLKDIMDSKLSNKEKTQRANALNKDGTAIPLPKD